MRIWNSDSVLGHGLGVLAGQIALILEHDRVNASPRRPGLDPGPVSIGSNEIPDQVRDSTGILNEPKSMPFGVRRA